MQMTKVLDKDDPNLKFASKLVKDNMKDVEIDINPDHFNLMSKTRKVDLPNGGWVSIKANKKVGKGWLAFGIIYHVPE